MQSQSSSTVPEESGAGAAGSTLHAAPAVVICMAAGTEKGEDGEEEEEKEEREEKEEKEKEEKEE